MQNSAHALSAEFTSTGVDLRHGSDHWTMALRGYGRGDRLHATSAAKPRANANRVEYRRGSLTEWYVNGPLGLEQGFTLARAPGKPDDGPLTLALDLSGDLSASLDPGARGLTLRHGDSAELRYTGLSARDASGRELQAWLELGADQLRVRVNDAGAEYPVIIDPMFQAVKLNSNQSLCTIGGVCDQGNSGDRFGWSVALSSDGGIAAVAAPHATGGNVDSGAVYVFLRSARFGWGGCIVVGCHDYVAKLTTPPVQHGFGASVAISGDGNTIAVLGDTLPTADYSPGIIWVYQKPATGWTSTSQFVAILSLEASTEQPCGLTDPNPPDCSVGSDFTSSIDVNGDGSTIVLGYSGAVVGGQSRGAVYVFVRPGTGWVNNANGVKLTRSGGAHLDSLGQAVSISSDGSTIAAAAPQVGGIDGAIDVFVKGASGWVNATQTAELTYAAGDGLFFLGASGVAIDSNGRTVAAGGNGRALIFPEPFRLICLPTCVPLYGWRDRNESAQLTASDSSPIGRPRISGDGTLVAAAGLQSSPGAVYLFGEPKSGWVSATETEQVVASDGAPGDQLGVSPYVGGGAPALGLSSNGTTLLAGAPGATIGNNANQGAAYVFTGQAGPDRDADGVPDRLDNCPYYPNPNQADVDVNGRGDVCECSDQNLDGHVDVSDIVAINAAIFNPALVTPLCDGNNDGLCNVSDIVAANRTIFTPKTSTCERQPVPGP